MLNILHMTLAALQSVSGIEIRGVMRPDYERLLSPDAMQFEGLLHLHFNPRREFLSETRDVRERVFIADFEDSNAPTWSKSQ
jgi:malate synthase